MNKKILILTFLLASCKDSHWGDKALTFAHNEAPGIVESLSQKDLELKWYEFYQTALSHSMEEITKANLILNSFEPLDFTDLDKDKTKLMKTAYQLDQQIEKLYTVNSIIYNAVQTRKVLLGACEDQEQMRIYTENRTYLLSALQMSAPQLNVSYGIVATFNMGDGDSRPSKEQKETDDNTLKFANSLPLLGNFTAIFTKKMFDKNMAKFNEAQAYINNIKLDNAKLSETSTSICKTNTEFFKQATDELDNNIFVVQNTFINLYRALVNLRDALAPKVIANIIETRFSAEEKEIYSVQADNQYTARMMEIYKTIQAISMMSPASKEDLMEIEKRIDVLSDLENELEIKKSSTLGKKNSALIASIQKLLKIKKLQLSNSFSLGVH